MIQINNELRDRAYKCACDHGFHDKEYPTEHWFMLIITEISEAVDADRKNKLITKDDIIAYNKLQSERFHKCAYEEYVKGCIGEELADVIIRCLDFAGLKNRNIDISSMPSQIPDHELYDTITVFSYHLIKIIYDEDLTYEEKLFYIIANICLYCKKWNIDILWHIEQKIKYNELRPRLNGKKY